MVSFNRNRDWYSGPSPAVQTQQCAVNNIKLYIVDTDFFVFSNMTTITAYEEYIHNNRFIVM